MMVTKQSPDATDDNILGYLRMARSWAVELQRRGEMSRELSIVLTKINEAQLWRQEDIEIKAMGLMGEGSQPVDSEGLTKDDAKTPR